MNMHQLESLMAVNGVRGVAIVDRSGHTVSMLGRFSPLLQAHLARLWDRVDDEESDAVERPKLAELHWDGGVLLMAPVNTLLLVVLADREINLGMLRIRLRPVAVKVAETFSQLLPGKRGVA